MLRSFPILHFITYLYRKWSFWVSFLSSINRGCVSGARGLHRAFNNTACIRYAFSIELFRRWMLDLDLIQSAWHSGGISESLFYSSYAKTCKITQLQRSKNDLAGKHCRPYRLSLSAGLNFQWRSQLPTSKGDYWVKKWVLSIASLFKMGTSLKGKNLLPEGANYFLYEQFLIVCKIAFNALSDLPWMLLYITHVRNLRNGCYANDFKFYQRTIQSFHSSG